jgi:hypothetical protein
MSGTKSVGPLMRTEAAGVVVQTTPGSADRLAWPAAALLIFLLSAGMWLGIAWLVQRLAA